MKQYMRPLAAALALVFITSSCMVVRQGTVGVKRTTGIIKEKPLGPGPKLFVPFFQVIIPMPTRTVNLEVNLNLPSKEGVNVNADISILYRIDGKQATSIVENIGRNYEQVVILPVFRAAAADITAKYLAKDMHTGNRLEIEEAIKDRMTVLLEERGIIIDAVLMKSIVLPNGLARAIEEKLEAEQESQRMEFVLTREKQEAERRRIEAEGIKEANQIIAEGLTPAIIKYKSIEAFKDLSQSPNTKVILTDGSTPLLIKE
ncbi:MAG: prohibitin family protein [Schleiferiaceae bacterium]|nr:prohibitin family protein [Schleiferiaceae bacterium]